MLKKVLYYCLLFISALALQAADLPQIQLNPPDTLIAVEGMPFVQAVPVPQGSLNMEADEWLAIASDGIMGEGRRTTLWPDGSVQWLLVRGILTSGFEPGDSPLKVSLRKAGFSTNNDARTGIRAEWRGGKVEIEGGGAEAPLALVLSASMIAVSGQVSVTSKEPDYLDETGQYLWAAPVEIVSPDASPLPLTFVLKEESYHESLQSREFLFRGEAHHPDVSGWLEWQLRLNASEYTEVLRTEMTWSAFWDEQKWALSGAMLTIETGGGWIEAKAGDVTESLEQSQSFSLANQPNGEGAINGEESGEPLANTVVLKREGSQFLGLALPSFNKLGPNRIEISSNDLKIHFWDLQSGRVLDLRRTGEDDEFNIASVDFKSRPLGLSRTMDIALVPGVDANQVEVTTRALDERQDQWFPTASEILSTEVLGPVLPQVPENNQEYLLGLQANLHFLKQSQDRWKWYGFINYGDVRTNFAFGRNPDRGLFPLRWALSGRYGWRNVSGDVPYSLLFAGLLLDDREIVLMGLDYMRHVIDVDFAHLPVSRGPGANAGGFHRRNRDHWSGSVQMQYSPSNGIYLGSWLSGSARARQALQSLREYSLDDGRQGSVLGAQAWINHYRETHAADTLEIAKDLLADNAAWWESRPGAQAEDLEALYEGNFRWLSDGVKTLMAFYEATGEVDYLELIKNLLLREINGAYGLGSIAMQGESVTGYLIGAGLQVDTVSEQQYEEIRRFIRDQTPGALPQKELWNYDLLVEIVTQILPGAPSPNLRESNAIGRRAVNSWFALNLLEAEFLQSELEAGAELNAKANEAP